jgi:hypothetical protein
MAERLPAHVEAAALIRRAEAEGGFAAVLRKGDPDRGALTLIVRGRGELRGLLERELGPDFTYRWVFREADEASGSTHLSDLIASKERFDRDFWLIELDIAEPERFIAETTGSG